MSNEANLKIFSNQVEAFRIKTRQRLDIAKKEVAKELINRITSRSPVDTGSFCLSNKVGLGVMDSSVERRLTPAADPFSVRAQTRAAAYAKIAMTEEDQTIWISNSIDHAMIVEKLGWSTPDGGIKPAYHVYSLSIEGVRANLPAIINRVENMSL